MKVKEYTAKAELCLNVKTTKSVSTEYMHNFKTGNEDTTIVKTFACLCLVINSNGEFSQAMKRRLRVRGAAMEKLGEITKIFVSMILEK